MNTEEKKEITEKVDKKPEARKAPAVDVDKPTVDKPEKKIEEKKEIRPATEEAQEPKKDEWLSEDVTPKKTKQVTTPQIKKKKKKKGPIKIVKKGQAYIQATYNNTVITLTDPNGNVIAWSSAGVMGFKGPKKSTPFAAGIIAKDAVEKAKARGLEEVNVFIKGVGLGREAAIRGLHANGLNISSIKDVTPVPHNGCRRRKKRRI